MRYAVYGVLVLALAGCSGQGSGMMSKFKRESVVMAEKPAVVPPASETEGDPFTVPIEKPPEGARSVEEFDTTTAEQREAAVAASPEPTSDGKLGVTIASLGDPAEPGFWIKTPLVSEETSGRAVYVTSGRSVQVTLIPSGGAAGSGSQVSLAAMRLLDAPLTELPELVIYTNS